MVRVQPARRIRRRLARVRRRHPLGGHGRARGCGNRLVRYRRRDDRLVRDPTATGRAGTAPLSQTTGIVGRTYLERGAPVVVLAQWAGAGPRNVLVSRVDDSRVVRPFRGLRRAVGEAPSGLEPLYEALQASA